MFAGLIKKIGSSTPPLPLATTPAAWLCYPFHLGPHLAQGGPMRKKSSSTRLSPTRQAVERGARVLTIHYGNEEWLRKIQAKDLDLGNPRWCMLGQLTGRYDKGLDLLGPGVKSEPGYFGFDQVNGKGYSWLTIVWRNLIARKKRILGWA